MSSVDKQTLDWLLEPSNPSVRYLALTELLHRGPKDTDVLAAGEKIPRSRIVRRIMAEQTRDGFWPPKDDCYTPKWTSAVWPLMLLGELAVPADDRIKGEVERFLDLHQVESGAFSCPSKFQRGKRWDEPCLTGNMIRTLIRLGYRNGRRVGRAIDWLPVQQLEDGGWNCDFPEKKVKHSSFMSTIEPLWAYSEIAPSTWTRKMKRSIQDGAEFLLMHHVYKSDNHHWRETQPFFTRLHFPMYYFYDVLHGIRVLTKLGYSDDERIRSAVQLVLSKRRPDGRWNLEGDWWTEEDFFHPTRKGRKAPVKVDEIGKPSKWVTLNAYRALADTGNLKV